MKLSSEEFVREKFQDSVTLTLERRHAIQLKAILKYAYKSYTSNKDSINEQTEQVILELLAIIKEQLK